MLLRIAKLDGDSNKFFKYGNQKQFRLLFQSLQQDTKHKEFEFFKMIRIFIDGFDHSLFCFDPLLLGLSEFILQMEKVRQLAKVTQAR